MIKLTRQLRRPQNVWVVGDGNRLILFFIINIILFFITISKLLDDKNYTGS